MTMSHRKAAVFTARRYELFEVVNSTLTYLHPDSRVHSFLSPLPYQVIDFLGYYYSCLDRRCWSSRFLSYLIIIKMSEVVTSCSGLNFYLYIVLEKSVLYLQRCLQFDMPRLLAFDLLRETDQEFEARTGWTYQTTSPVSFPAVLINVNPPQ